MQQSFAGSWAALVTPFHHGEIDQQALYKLLDYHVSAGTDGLVICGTTGESATMSAAEKLSLMKLCREKVGEKIPLVFGTGSNNTRTAVELTAQAAHAGARGVLVVTPYYNKPTQDGLKAHFTEIAKATSLPVILYNVPGRTGVNMLPQTTLELARIPNVTAVKEASGNLDQIIDILRGAPADFDVLSGDDGLNFPILALGGKGVISVTANVAPRLMKKFTDAARDKRWDEARELHFSLMDLHRAMFLESNPIPAKTALHLMGYIQEEFRLPLVKGTAATKAKLRETLERMGLLP